MWVGQNLKDRLAWDAGPLDTRGRISAIGEAIWKGGGGKDKPRENKGSTSSNCVFWSEASVEEQMGLMV